MITWCVKIMLVMWWLQVEFLHFYSLWPGCFNSIIFSFWKKVFLLAVFGQERIQHEKFETFSRVRKVQPSEAQARKPNDLYLSRIVMKFQNSLFNYKLWSFSSVSLFQKWWGHHESSSNSSAKVDNSVWLFPSWMKKLINLFGQIEGPTILSVLSKNGYQIFILPEITDVWSGRKWKSFETGSQKIYFWKAFKKLLRNLNSRYLVTRRR